MTKYRQAIEWIALEDDNGSSQRLDLETFSPWHKGWKIKWLPNIGSDTGGFYRAVKGEMSCQARTLAGLKAKINTWEALPTSR
jgi:hypothetical protein